MTQDQRPYYDNPYLTTSAGGREKMNFVRSALLICATLLLSITVYTLYNYYQNRYIIVSQNSGLYIFDRNDSQVHFCDQNNCKAVTPQYTLQAMIQALPQSGLGGGTAITLPQGLHSALGNQGNPMALAQALLAQGNKKTSNDSASTNNESVNANNKNNDGYNTDYNDTKDDFEDNSAGFESDEDSDFGSANDDFSQTDNASEFSFGQNGEETSDFGGGSTEDNDFGDPSGGFETNESDDEAFVAGADF